MLEDASKHEAHRSKNQMSETEKRLWPKGGYKAIKKASSELLKRIKHGLKEEPSLANLYKYQMYIALKLFAEVPLRNTAASLSVKENAGGNYIDLPKKGSASLVIRKHKASKKIGERVIKLSRGMTTALRKFLRYREPLVKHDFLLSTRTGTKLSKPAFGKALHRVTKNLLNKAFGSRLIRVLAATEKAPVLTEAADLTHKMLHKSGGAQTKLYVRKQ
jgi:hypothetical protein